MLNTNLYLTLLYLIIYMATPAVSSASQVMPNVTMLYGKGFSPLHMKQGEPLKKGTKTIKADSETIVVLHRTWNIEKKEEKKNFDVYYYCEDWIIISGNEYTVDLSTTEDCSEQGNGDEIERAMNGESISTHFTLLGFSMPNAMIISPQNLQKIRSDLEKLQKLPKNIPPMIKQHQPPYGNSYQKFTPVLPQNLNTFQTTQTITPPKPNKQTGFIKSSFKIQQKDSTWFVSGVIRNTTKKHQPCIR